jgi:hypothetical protein
MVHDAEEQLEVSIRGRGGSRRTDDPIARNRSPVPNNIWPAPRNIARFKNKNPIPPARRKMPE